mmetsp:Transcript_31667/g.51195  ORF Transcript_31667/g.51195 Transcript_31667/m.51195 type:complete len:106 (-) Transcript_31667:1159-1476(-)
MAASMSSRMQKSKSHRCPSPVVLRANKRQLPQKSLTEVVELATIHRSFPQRRDLDMSLPKRHSFLLHLRRRKKKHNKVEQIHHASMLHEDVPTPSSRRLHSASFA